MPLTPQQKTEIEQIIIDALQAKFQNLNPEPAVMPFHTHLLSSNRLALYSSVHSFYTSFGTTIFEPVAEKIALPRFKCTRNMKARRLISSDAESVISDIMNELTRKATVPNKKSEIARIRAVCQSGDAKPIKPTNHDLCLTSRATGEVYFIDIKTPKPNSGGFKGFKRTILEWYAVYLYENPKAPVHSIIALPYNPYAPGPYSNWTAHGMMDMGNDLWVAEGFWNFLAEDDIYNDLLGCFRRAGEATRDAVNQHFNRFNT